MKDTITARGEVTVSIRHADGRVESRSFPNRVLRTGRNAMASVLANDVAASFDLYVNRMIFGTNGTSGGVPKEVEDTRTGLFGPVLISKPVIAAVNTSLPSQVTFTSVLQFTEGVGSQLNEMALAFSNGDYFSMATFGDISKTSSMELVFNWSISYL